MKNPIDIVFIEHNGRNQIVFKRKDKSRRYKAKEKYMSWLSSISYSSRFETHLMSYGCFQDTTITCANLTDD